MTSSSGAEPKAGPAFVIAHTVFRLAQATTVASMISFLLVLALGLFVEEGPEVLPPGWPAGRLVAEALLPTLAALGLGLLVIGPARTAQQITLAGLLIRAGEQPGAGLAVPDPRGPVSRRPYLISMITAVGLLIAAPVVLGVAFDRLDGSRPVVISAAALLVGAVIAIPCLVIADRRWRAEALPRLAGHLTPEPPAAAGLRDKVTRSDQGRFRPVAWLYVLGTVALLIVNWLRNPDSGRVSVDRGTVLASVIEWLVIIGCVMIVLAAVANLLVRLIRAIAGLIRLGGLINAPVDPARPADPAPADADPAGQLSLVLAGFGVVVGEWLFALNRLSSIPYPSLAGLAAALPMINIAWLALMIIVAVGTAAACRFAGWARNRLRGVLSDA
ncbi:hypothetical protein [Microlunatus parietis]|uniref:Uncharacterized protein n=1 Tax=Microlunatus parietis TaxID=682979 RepID=A0A7Y9LBR9_9ACTN|nr:hypothetical protein [Microlunatus parietis]NYE70111.1 hypothetical protein [Microlunatus parietis]